MADNPKKRLYQKRQFDSSTDDNYLEELAYPSDELAAAYEFSRIYRPPTEELGPQQLNLVETPPGSGIYAFDIAGGSSDEE